MPVNLQHFTGMARFWWRIRFTAYGCRHYGAGLLRVWWQMSAESFDAYDDEDRYPPGDQLEEELYALGR